MDTSKRKLAKDNVVFDGHQFKLGAAITWGLPGRERNVRLVFPEGSVKKRALLKKNLEALGQGAGPGRNASVSLG